MNLSVLFRNFRLPLSPKAIAFSVLLVSAWFASDRSQSTAQDAAAIASDSTIDDANAASQTQPAKSSVVYNRDVRPILADNCFSCHGPDSASRLLEIGVAESDGFDVIVHAMPARDKFLET